MYILVTTTTSLFLKNIISVFIISSFIPWQVKDTGMKVSNFNVITGRMVFIFLQVFTEYFKELEEESIRDNFVIIYELLDELVDFGYPQFTETKILQEYVTIIFFCYNNSNYVYTGVFIIEEEIIWILVLLRSN